MLEHSPYTSSRPEQCIDFELALTIDECPLTIRPVRSRGSAVVSWECGLCGHTEIIHALPSRNHDFLVTAAKLEAGKHIARKHTGPSLRALLGAF